LKSQTVIANTNSLYDCAGPDTLISPVATNLKENYRGKRRG